MDAKRQQLSRLKDQVEALPPESASEISELKRRIAQLEDQISRERDSWDHVLLSRHESRPYTLDYVSRIFRGFREIHGDRKYADDPAIVAGMAWLEEEAVLLVGQQKGRNTKERLFRSYGMPKPEGYRKAIRLMQLAEKFRRPVISFIDTPGAYPGIGAEERGQAEAIAYNLRTMAQLRVPILVAILGEGGSGGALAIGVGDRVLMLEHATYSVISPESCSAILWKDQEHAREAAESLKLTAGDLLKFGIIDEIVPEPEGGAHLDWDETASSLKKALIRHLRELQEQPLEELLEARYRRFRRLGSVIES